MPTFVTHLAVTSMLFALTCFEAAGAQTAYRVRVGQTVRPCRANQVELYSEGGEGSTGHFSLGYDIRNVSGEACSVLGAPSLRFLDQQGHPLKLPYNSNASSYATPRVPPLRPVVLQPGDFAYFLIGADNRLPGYHRLEILLPHDQTPLSMGAGREEDAPWGEGSVSALGAGVSSEFNFVAPTRSVRVVSGSLRGFELSLSVPPNAEGHLDAHLTLQNPTTSTLRFDAATCTISVKLVDAGRHEVAYKEPCGQSAVSATGASWLGQIHEDGAMQPGTRASMDHNVGWYPGLVDPRSDRADIARSCQDRWNVEITISTSVGAEQFAPVPIKPARCP